MTETSHEKTLETAVKKAQAAVKKKPTNENLKTLETAGRMLKEHRAQNEIDLKKQSFKNVAEVLEYLKADGWKVEKSKLYSDDNKIGKQRDGTYLKKDVDKYADIFLKKLDASDENLTSLAIKKAKLEMEKEEELLKKIRRLNDIAEGRLFARTEVKQMHTRKLARLISLIENFIYGRHMEELLEGLGCDLARIPDAQDEIEKYLREMLADYAKTAKFTIPKKSLIEAEELMATNE